MSEDVRFEGIHCTLVIRRPAPGVLVLAFSGKDVGEFGAAPFRELEKEIQSDRHPELFLDARDATSATVDVSSEWALWLQGKKNLLRRVNMLTASRFIQISAEFVKKFAGMGDVMRVYTDARAFDEALEQAVVAAGAR